MISLAPTICEPVFPFASSREAGGKENRDILNFLISQGELTDMKRGRESFLGEPDLLMATDGPSLLPTLRFVPNHRL